MLKHASTASTRPLRGAGSAWGSSASTGRGIRRLHLAPAASGSSRSPEASDRPNFCDPTVPLPGGVWLRDPSFHPPTAFVQGDNFVWHYRPGFTMPAQAKVETTQLVPYSRPQQTSLEPLQRKEVLPPVVSPMARKTAMVPVGFNTGPCALVSLLETSCNQASDACTPFPPTSCTGMILHETAGSSATKDQDVAVYETNNTSSPRRTQKIKFTCRVCGSINIKPINPHAWQKGSVFARCSGCNITHKLIDNLKLFHELNGPVFPRPAPDCELPESLRLDESAVHEERPIDSLWLLDINPEIGF